MFLKYLYKSYLHAFYNRDFWSISTSILFCTSAISTLTSRQAIIREQILVIKDLTSLSMEYKFLFIDFEKEIACACVRAHTHTRARAYLLQA